MNAEIEIGMFAGQPAIPTPRLPRRATAGNHPDGTITLVVVTTPLRHPSMVAQVAPWVAPMSSAITIRRIEAPDRVWATDVRAAVGAAVDRVAGGLAAQADESDSETAHARPTRSRRVDAKVGAFM